MPRALLLSLKEFNILKIVDKELQSFSMFLLFAVRIPNEDRTADRSQPWSTLPDHMTR